MRNLMLTGCLPASVQVHAATIWQVSGEAGDQAQVQAQTQDSAQQTATLVFVRSNTNPNPDSSTNLSINGRYLTSLQVGQDNKPTLRALDPKEAKDLLANTHRQTHLVSRSFAKDCKVVY